MLKSAFKLKCAPLFLLAQLVEAGAAIEIHSTRSEEEEKEEEEEEESVLCDVARFSLVC